jgi:FixJ family two-component response regulator
VSADPEALLVYVVDDDEAFRDSLRWLLESAGYRVAAFASAERFLEAYRPGTGACLVLDVRMPGLSGLELQEELNRRGHTLPTIFVTGHGDVPMAVSAVKHGAFDFIEKPFNDEALLVLIGKAAQASAAARRESAQRLDTAARLATLTEREREVMDLVIAGKKNKEIACTLGISIKTVEIHRGRVMEKMGVESVAELVRAALGHKSPRKL